MTLKEFIERSKLRRRHCGSDTERHKNLVSAPLFTFGFHFRLEPKISVYLLSSLLLLRLSHMMASIDLNYIQFYQPPAKASLPRERIPEASNATAPAVVNKGKSSKVPESSNGWDQSLWCGDTIEFVDMTGSPPREDFSPADIRGRIFGRSLTKSP